MLQFLMINLLLAPMELNITFYFNNYFKIISEIQQELGVKKNAILTSTYILLNKEFQERDTGWVRDMIIMHHAGKCTATIDVFFT